MLSVRVGHLLTSIVCNISLDLAQKFGKSIRSARDIAMRVVLGHAVKCYAAILIRLAS